jgi:hypothetical protein
MFLRIGWLLLPAIVAGCSSPKLTGTGSGCENCHRPVNMDGLEQQHPLFALRCVHCHGGNELSESVEEAHVARPAGLESLRSLPAMELAAIDPAYRQFVNPTDPGVAAQTCGTSGANGCHQDVVDQSRNSVHATNAGVVNTARFTAGLSPSRQPQLAVVATSSLSGLTVRALPPNPTLADASRILDHALAKNCSGCHLNVYGAQGQGRPNGDFAGGCAACHVFYDDDGLSRSADPSREKESKPHPVKHVIELSIPDRQCQRCHSRSLRIGQQFRGWRESVAGEDLTNADVVEEALYGRPAGYFVADSDTRDNIDDTPPDIHQQMGMGCVDCHLAPDGHGNGTVRSNMGKEVTIECQDCHGTFDAEISAAEDGMFRTSGGAALRRLRKEGDQYFLTGALDGADHPVTQVINVRPSLAEENAHKTENHRELECYACHTAWMQNAILLRRTVDYRSMTTNPLDGSASAAIYETNEIQTEGDHFIGINSEGKIGPFMVENAVLDVIVPCNPANEPPNTCTNSPEQQVFGKKVIDGWFPMTTEGRRGLSWTPVFPHTTATRGTVQPCSRCHPKPLEPDPLRVPGTFGYGNGKFMFAQTGTTATFDLTQMVDALGVPTVALGTPDTRPVPFARIQRAMQFVVEPPLE